MLGVAKRSARNQRIAGLCQIRHLAFCAPDELRVQLKGLNTNQLVAKTVGLRPARNGDVVLSMTKLALRGSAGECSTSRRRSRVSNVNSRRW